MGAIVQKHVHQFMRQCDVGVSGQCGHPHSEAKVWVAPAVARSEGHGIVGGPVQGIADKKHPGTARGDFSGEQPRVAAGKISETRISLDFKHRGGPYRDAAGYDQGCALLRNFLNPFHIPAAIAHHHKGRRERFATVRMIILPGRQGTHRKALQIALPYQIGGLGDQAVSDKVAMRGLCQRQNPLSQFDGGQFRRVQQDT